jgi:hypothetical protein
MADATLTSLDVQDGVLHIYGTNFTQTTTTVYVNDVTTPAAFVSSTELTIDPAPAAGAEIVVEKGGVQSEAMAIGGSAVAPTEPAADIEPPAGGSEGNTGLLPAEDTRRVQEVDPGSDPVGEPVQPGPLAEVMTLAPTEPYPTGNPPDPEDQFFAAHGFRRAAA